EDCRLRGLAEQATGLAAAHERTVETTERLDPDQVTEDEHVERDLQPELLLHLARGRRVLAGLVVLDDSARAQRLDVDAVDLPGEDDAVAELEPALQLGRRALETERDLELTRLERRLALGLDANEPLEVAREGQLRAPGRGARHL